MKEKETQGGIQNPKTGRGYEPEEQCSMFDLHDLLPTRSAEILFGQKTCRSHVLRYHDAGTLQRSFVFRSREYGPQIYLSLQLLDSDLAPPAAADGAQSGRLRNLSVELAIAYC